MRKFAISPFVVVTIAVHMQKSVEKYKKWVHYRKIKAPHQKCYVERFELSALNLVLKFGARKNEIKQNESLVSIIINYHT